MNYNFPEINNINDVLPAIRGRSEFIVADRGRYQVINYMVAFADTFPDVTSDEHAILRECRGLIFDDKGNLISRRFHKFFNVGEKDETHINNLDLAKPHTFLEKLDGSMITPLRFDGAYRLATKMGITDVAMAAERYYIKHYLAYYHLFDYCHQNKLTPIFEFVSPTNRIVVPYAKEDLILLAIRENVSGRYFSYDEMFKLVKHLSNNGNDYAMIPIVDPVSNLYDLSTFINRTKNSVDIEGYILRFDDGHMVKIKGDWYLNLHKVKDELSRENNVVELILDNKIDDLISLLDKPDVERIQNFSTKVHAFITNKVNEYNIWFSENTHGKDRKEVALGYAKTLNPANRQMLFKFMDGNNMKIELTNYISKCARKPSTYDEFRKEFPEFPTF